MVCCTHEECVKAAEFVAGAPELFRQMGVSTRANPTDPVSCEGTIHHAVVPYCVFCAKTQHQEHIAHLQAIGTIGNVIQRWNGNADQATVHKGFYANKKPSHLAMLDKENMELFVKTLLVCARPGCNLAYCSKRFPIMLDCGHLVCKRCEEIVLAPNYRIPGMGQCGRTQCAKKPQQRRVVQTTLRQPEDIKYLLVCKMRDYPECSKCNNRVSKDHIVEGTDSCCIACSIVQ
ncbi:hypothetical protein PFISCL1PPCAC_4125 [Pristionchus fissidentatus]|uniref:RING-type domain-containing protein n=1 Tax=Pristionchus fissidentatus TaxID=1538716 RepID=A0AAV5V1A5_9BILA|nr:hypothetical protein PFISCL1PPCAC_4125 [Pristionchus fissidentatus]